MSTRAYKVLVPAVTSDDCSWNVSRDDEINDYLKLYDYEGQQAVQVEVIQNLIKESWLDEYSREKFTEDIKGEASDNVIYYELY